MRTSRHLFSAGTEHRSHTQSKCDAPVPCDSEETYTSHKRSYLSVCWRNDRLEHVPNRMRHPYDLGASDMARLNPARTTLSHRIRTYHQQSDDLESHEHPCSCQRLSCSPRHPSG